MVPLQAVVGKTKWSSQYENSTGASPKIKPRTTDDPAIHILGIYPKALKSRSQRDSSTPMMTEALFTIAKMWKQPECPLKDK
jgi:hypothetical protein